LAIAAEAISPHAVVNVPERVSVGRFSGDHHWPVLGDRRGKVYVDTQKTQTVKICTDSNMQGTYEKYYRIRPPYVLNRREIERRISEFASLPELEGWLIDDRKATRERENEARPPGRVGLTPEPPLRAEDSPEVPPEEDEVSGSVEVVNTVAEILDLLSTEKYSPDDDPWLPNAKDLVEQSIDRLLQEFLEYPYLHRKEHSIHAQLFWTMMTHPELAARVPIGNDLALTQLVHKEWPESVGRGGNRRGSFDLVVVSPKLLRGCPSIDAFIHGHLLAPIVIEIGLDYDVQHLAGDAKKLINSKPKFGYLIHLVREFARDPVAEKILLDIEAKFGIKTAYGLRTGRQTIFKRVNDRSISEQRSEG
jgi:hypothetical protein